MVARSRWLHSCQVSYATLRHYHPAFGRPPASRGRWLVVCGAQARRQPPPLPRCGGRARPPASAGACLSLRQCPAMSQGLAILAVAGLPTGLVQLPRRNQKSTRATAPRASSLCLHTACVRLPHHSTRPLTRLAHAICTYVCFNPLRLTSGTLRYTSALFPALAPVFQLTHKCFGGCALCGVVTKAVNMSHSQ